jgi:hypothetical protein
MISNITNYKNVGDWFFLFTAVLVVDFIVIVFAKYDYNSKSFNKKSLNKWYDDFGIFALISDILSILIGICVARYIYTCMNLSNPLYFILILVGFQLLHDTLFYLLVIKQVDKGHNRMIDVFKTYANENGLRILFADALMMVSSVVLGSLLKSNPAHITTSIGFVTTYILCYIIYTNTPNL